MKLKAIIMFAAILVLLAGCDNPAGTTGEDESDPLVGTWRNAAETNYVILNSDGTAETPDLKGTWTSSAGRIILNITSRKVSGVFETATGTLEWNYLLYNGKLYRDPDIYIFERTTAGTGIVGTYERIKQAEDESWVKEVVSLDTTVEYEVYANTPADYNPDDGTGTWVSSVILTGTIAALPADNPVGGKVIALDVTGVAPVVPEFPSKVYQFVFWTTDRLSIDCEGFIKSE